MAADFAGDEVVRLADREHDAKIQFHPAGVALGAGNGFQKVGDVRLRSFIELHVRMDGEVVTAFLAGRAPFGPLLDSAPVDQEGARLTDSATDVSEPGFDLFRSNRCHARSIAVGGEERQVEAPRFLSEYGAPVGSSTLSCHGA